MDPFPVQYAIKDMIRVSKIIIGKVMHYNNCDDIPCYCNKKAICNIIQK